MLALVMALAEERQENEGHDIKLIHIAGVALFLSFVGWVAKSPEDTPNS